MQLVQIMFQNMFPVINVHTVCSSDDPIVNFYFLLCTFVNSISFEDNGG